MSRESPQFKLRMPEDLHAQIAKSAEEQGRSMNAEIVIRLQRSLELDSDALINARERLATIATDRVVLDSEGPADAAVSRLMRIRRQLADAAQQLQIYEQEAAAKRGNKK